MKNGVDSGDSGGTTDLFTREQRAHDDHTAHRIDDEASIEPDGELAARDRTIDDVMGPAGGRPLLDRASDSREIGLGVVEEKHPEDGTTERRLTERGRREDISDEVVPEALGPRKRWRDLGGSRRERRGHQLTLAGPASIDARAVHARERGDSLDAERRVADTGHLLERRGEHGLDDRCAAGSLERTDRHRGER